MRLLISLSAVLLLAGCFAWETDVERGGYAFDRYRQDTQSGAHIGILADTREIDGFICRGEDWAHFRPDWSLSGCFLAQPYAMDHVQIAAGTWVMPHSDRLVVAFQQDTPCQGHVCSGTGGAKGTQTSFYPDGRLREFFPTSTVSISGVQCRASPFASVQLHENGGLKRCTAALDGEIGGAPYQAGQIITLDETGAPG